MRQRFRYDLHGIDLTRMECKDLKRNAHTDLFYSIDLTRMECKGDKQ